MPPSNPKLKPSVAMPRLLLTACLFIAAAFSTGAQATLVGDSVSVSLSSPNGVIISSTPISETNSALIVGAGNEITQEDGSPVASLMLSGEYIDFQASAISLRLACGDDSTGPCMTGYSTGAKYIFGGLDDSLGTITGFSLLHSGFNNFSTSWVSLINAHTISLALDTMEFTDLGQGTSNNFGLLTINLTISRDQPPDNNVPEPSSVALVALASLTLIGARGRERRQ